MLERIRWEPRWWSFLLLLSALRWRHRGIKDGLDKHSWGSRELWKQCSGLLIVKDAKSCLALFCLERHHIYIGFYLLYSLVCFSWIGWLFFSCISFFLTVSGSPLVSAQFCSGVLSLVCPTCLKMSAGLKIKPWPINEYWNCHVMPTCQDTKIYFQAIYSLQSSLPDYFRALLLTSMRRRRGHAMNILCVPILI